MCSAEHLIVVRLAYVTLGVAPRFHKEACVKSVNNNKHCTRVNNLGNFFYIIA